MTAPAAPRLSVIVATRRKFEELDDLLLALVPQVREVGGEIVLVCGGMTRADEARAIRAPTGVHYVASDDRNLMSLRARGLREASGDVIAIGEDHAYPMPGWAEAVVRAHRENPDVPLVVGCLSNGTVGTASARANFLAFASPFMPPMAELPSRPPAISTVSIKRDALGGVEERTGDFEIELLPRLHREHAMVADDRIVLDHRQPFGAFRAVLNGFDVARASYGYLRSRWAPGERQKPARLAIQVGRLVWFEARSRYREAGSPRSDLVLVAFIAVSTACGAAVGARWGPSRSAERTL